jgi:hypothetical protein
LSNFSLHQHVGGRSPDFLLKVLFTVAGLNSTENRKPVGDDSMVSSDQAGRSRKLAYLGVSMAVGAALAVAGVVVGTDGADTQSAMPIESSPRDAVAAVAPATVPARMDQRMDQPYRPRFTPQIPAELLVPPRSVTAAPVQSPESRSMSVGSDTTGSIPVAAAPAVVPTPKKRPVQETRQAEPPRSETASAQIARIKVALKLTKEQEPYWPPVEAALRDIVTQMGHGPTQSRGLGRNPVSIDPERVQRLTSAAMPLLMTFDELQKQEVRRIARNMGLETVAASI